MVARTSVRSEKHRSATQKQNRVASPVGGLNFVNNTMDFPNIDAYILDNAFPRPYGCEIRKGFQNWIPSADRFPDQVKSVLTFASAKKADSDIFASYAQNPSILYDVTTQNAAPVVSLTPSSNSDNPGEWYHTQFVTEGGNFMLAVSGGAGYYSYTVTTGVGAWTEHVDGTSAGEIEWPTLDTNTSKDIVFIWTWKSRVWFLVRDSAVAYYLPINQLSGKLEAFDFGQQLNLGGALLWASNWTYDSGAGIDDSLVLASTEGQILVYEGTDPAVAANFKLKGRWFAGRFPVGRRNFCEHGGSVLFICEYGLQSISDLVSGRLHTSNLSGTVGWKINPRLAGLVSENIDLEYWALVPYPTEEYLVLLTPLIDTTTGLKQQFVMNSLTNAWGTFSGLNMKSADVFYGKFIAGTDDGLINQDFVGYEDGVSSDGTVKGDIVTARIQGAFDDYGSPIMNKRMLRIKVYGLANAQPTFFARFLAEYNLTTPIDAPTPKQSIYPLWDDAIWDENIWAEGDGSFHQWFGLSGFGKKVSLQLAIRGAGRVVYTDHETLYEQGIGL